MTNETEDRGGMRFHGAGEFIRLDGGTLDIGIWRPMAQAWPGKPLWFVRLVSHRPMWWFRRWLGYKSGPDLSSFIESWHEPEDGLTP